MAISREKKEELVGKYVADFQDSEAIIITDYRGLKVREIEQLRIKIREAEGGFAVVKNSLARRALNEAGLPIPDEMLVGPVGIGFCYHNIPAVAKAITTFAKQNEMISIKGGIMGDKVINEATVRNLADLPPLEVIRGQLLGLINAPASRLAGVVASGVRQVVNVIHAYAETETEAGAEA